MPYFLSWAPCCLLLTAISPSVSLGRRCSQCSLVDEHARVLEEQWIDSLDGPNGDLSNSQTAVSSLHNGIVFGFFFPLLPLFFFRGHKPAVFWDDGSEHDVLEEPVFS